MTVRPAATILVPTHDHGPLLRFSLGSVLAQTIADIEVFVVGDGVPDVTREIVGEIAARDARVRFFDNPKGPRHGEIHRHAALQEATGKVVLYLSDDDLWLPEHVDTMLAALADLDLASAVSLKTSPNGRFTVRIHDPGRHRGALLGGGRGIPLSCAGHSRAAYEGLPHGWRTTPPGISTDKYMWQQFLADPECRAGSALRLTVVSLGSPSRAGMTLDERLSEMAGLAECVADPALRGELHARALALVNEENEVLRQKQLRSREKLEALRAERVASRRGALARVRGRLRRG